MYDPEDDDDDDDDIHLKLNVGTALRWLIDFGAGDVPLGTLYDTWAFTEVSFANSMQAGWLEQCNNSPYLSGYKLTQKALDAIKESEND